MYLVHVILIVNSWWTPSGRSYWLQYSKSCLYVSMSSDQSVISEQSCLGASHLNPKILHLQIQKQGKWYSLKYPIADISVRATELVIF